MSKVETISKVLELGIVPVVRANSADEAIEYCKGLIEGGINTLEVTFTIPNAIEVFQRIQKELPADTLLGAGTVLDSTTARLAIMNGAKFIVSPSFDKEVAYKYGVDIIKLFPGSLTGPSYVKAIHGPYPHFQIMPTGGVSLDNLEDWFKAGVVAVGAGSNLVKGSKEEITQKAKEYLEKIAEVRK